MRSPRLSDTGPTRTCVGCGGRDAQAAMLRLRSRGNGALAITPRTESGRSAYIHAALPCVHGLLRSKFVGKSLRTTVTKDARIETIQVLEEQLASKTFAMSATPLPNTSAS